MIDAPAISLELLLRLEEVKPELVLPPAYIVKHDIELPGGVRQVVRDSGKALPEVHQLAPAQFTPLTKAWQELWKGINSELTGPEWRKLASCHRAFNNNNGYDCSQKKHGPFVDYINGRDLGAPLPKIECLVCGGALLRGIETTYKGEPHLQVETLDGTAAPPPLEWVLTRPHLYFEAVSVRPDGGVQSFSITEHPEYVPLVASTAVYLPMWKVKRVQG